MPTYHFDRLFQLDKIHVPRDFQPFSAEFWQTKNICLEIGAGKGKHALQFAKFNPDKVLIAIERTQEKFLAMQKQASLANLPNLYIIHADAIAWISHAVPPKSISELFILYPNPEPHNANQRWLNMPFFAFLLSRLKDNGRITLASNIQSYIDESFEKAVKVWQLTTTKNQIASNSERTHFEVKYLARGENCWQLDMVKPSGYLTDFDNK